MLGASLVLTAFAVLILSALTVLVQLTGMFLERWLFFAEAKHTVTLYYGAEAV